jgi:hypothetical protein
VNEKPTPLHAAAEALRADTAANLPRIAAAYGPVYARGWLMGRRNAADMLDRQAGALATVTPIRAETTQAA